MNVSSCILFLSVTHAQNLAASIPIEVEVLYHCKTTQEVVSIVKSSRTKIRCNLYVWI